MSKKTAPKKSPKRPASKEQAWDMKLPDENRKQLRIEAESLDDAYRETARIYNTPSFEASRVILAYSPNAGLDLLAVTDELKRANAEVNRGDLYKAEDMLMSQAHALQAMFVSLAERAQNQTTVQAMQGMLTLALKAQGQCRATLQTLVEVKYPRQVQFVKQQNIANNQQVNNAAVANGGAQTGASRPQEALNEPSKLLGGQNLERVDSRAQGTAVPAYPYLAAVGKIDGAENGPGQGACGAERLQGRHKADAA